MSKNAAACLVENDRGEILMVQRGYGRRKGTWTLPGGHVDRGETSRRAAARETKEETGIVVKITHKLFTGNRTPIKVYIGQRVGGRIKVQRKECLDVRWRDPNRIPGEELCFGYDHKALKLWADIKAGKAQPEWDFTAGNPAGSGDAASRRRKRQRATALVVKDGQYLLVKEKGGRRYSLPGGGIERDESALVAACREVSEEVGMLAYSAERLFDYTSAESVNHHKVVLVEAGGEPRIKDGELDSFRWWDGRETLDVFQHVTSIVERYEAGV